VGRGRLPVEWASVRRIFGLLAILLSAACTRVDTATGSGRHPWTKPNVLRIADISDPESFNPLLSTMDLVEDLSSLIFSYLVIADGHGKLIGDLATEVPSLANGEISADGKTYTYRLRKGIVWHDGVALTARDVAFTWRAVMNPANNVFHREGYDEVARIETPDPSTVIVHLKRRHPPFVTEFFTSLQEGAKVILPAHVLASLPNINRAPFNAAPIGSGPFKFVKWERGRAVELVRNDAYFKGRPKIERIDFRVIPDDATILDEVKTHNIDLVVSLPSPLFDGYRGIVGVKVQLFAWNGISVFAINNGKPGLRHVEVRQAIARAIDYDSIISKVTHGVGTPARDIIPAVAIGYTNNIPYAYDPAGARKLLDAAGWKPGLDGIRSKNGERLDFVLLTIAGSASSRAIAVQLQAQLRDIGLGLTLKTSPYNVIFSYDGPINARRYDFAIYSYTRPWDPDNSTYLDCDQFSPTGENSYAYCDPAVDAGERAGLSTDDPLKRAAIYHPLERRIHETVPYIPLYVPRRPTAINDDLKNYLPAPGIASWWNAWQWSI
jgi:peptide/nickel transport system substrate-binding protein